MFKTAVSRFPSQYSRITTADWVANRATYVQQLRMSRITSYLDKLSPEQRDAVTSDATALNILAGPGSGKTRVLTCRVAHKIIADEIAPDALCVLTFTNKAAREMKRRLCGLLDYELRARLSIGTFHSLCAKYLRTHGTRIGLPDDFSIIDASQGRAILKRVTMDLEDVQGLDRDLLLAEISRAKGKGQTPETYRPRYPFDKTVAAAFSRYQKSLEKSKNLDFDDLIIMGIRLIKEHPSIVKNIEHVLVDEFQDTSHVEFELLTLLCAARNSITVVGDPDQSIYGWRQADSGILGKLKNHFSTLESTNLEQNYRSTKSIVDCAMKILTQDDNRIKKKLTTVNMKGHPVYINSVQNPTDEAEFIVREITRLCSQSNGFYSWNDFAVLVRANAHTRPIEEALTRASIPYKVFGGQKFFERIEICDILAFLRFADSGGKHKSSFTRIINIPRRGVGAIQLQRLIDHAADSNVSLLDAVRALSIGNASKNAKLLAFADLIDELILGIEQKMEIVDLVQLVLSRTKYEAYLKNMYRADWESRWDNIDELVNHAASCKYRSKEDTENGSYIKRFLPVKVSEEADDPSMPINGVTLSTLHSAKGLEWPCVFLPALEEDIIPHVLAKELFEIEEERRLLYVGITRAQCLLYCTHSEVRYHFGRSLRQPRSRFLEDYVSESWITEEPPILTDETQKEVAELLNRKPKPVDLSKFQDQPPTMTTKTGFQKASVYYAAMQSKTFSTIATAQNASVAEKAKPSIFARQSKAFSTLKTAQNATIEEKAKPSIFSKLGESTPKNQLASKTERVSHDEKRRQESDTMAKRPKTVSNHTERRSTVEQTTKRNSTKKANSVRANADIRNFFAASTNFPVRAVDDKESGENLARKLIVGSQFTREL